MKSFQKSFSDRKEYKVLTLSNGLKVLLVKHEAADEGVDLKVNPNIAAVALCVASGCFQDPKDVQGMSHFLEHMIFMGSQKYPKENEFDQYVSAHGGYDNAYTECEHTMFHFDIIEKHLAGALDRFAQFFISPIMSVESMEREMLAVESEFQSNSIDDEVRIMQMFCSMIEDSHPASNFIWGNLKTLKDGVRKENLNRMLHEFRNRNYVAERMFICIQSSVDFTRLERTVTKYFSDIPRKSHDLDRTHKRNVFDIFKPNFHENIFFIKSTSEKCKALITFLLPAIDKDLKFLEYLASLIQYEGPGTLSNYFMDEHLALKVKAKIGSQSFEGNSKFTFFTIEVNLTSRGFRNFDEVLEALFAFLLLLKTTTLDEHKSRYEEFKEIKNTLFKYRKEKSPIENVQELAVYMRYFEDKDLIVGREICPEFDGKAMKTSIDRINEQKFNLMILSDQYQKYDKIEKWFGTEYAEVDFPKAYVRLWNERWLRNELFLPKTNEFVCKNFTIFSGSSDDDKHPRKIADSDTCECFYKLDRHFRLPHGYIFVFFSSHVTKSSVVNLNMTSIFSMCVKNFLSDKLFAATVVGYSYKLHSVDDGIILRLTGFNDVLPLIVDIITKTMKDLSKLVDKNVFETFKNELKKNCHNCLADGNLLNDDTRSTVLKKNHRSFFDRYENVNSLKFQDFVSFCESFQRSLKAKILIQGNFVESRALYIAQLIKTNLEMIDRGERTQTDSSEVCQLPQAFSFIKIKSFRDKNKNSIIKNFYQIDETSIRAECLGEFLVSLLNEPLFDTLRSHEQLGYGVACSLRKCSGTLGITITVEYQEDKNSADKIDDKIEEFLGKFADDLKLMSLKDFLSSLRSLMSLKLTPDAELECEVSRHFEEIRNGENIFDRDELEVFEIEKLTKDDVVEFFHETFRSKQHVRKLSVQVIGDGNDDKTDHLLCCDIKDFRGNLENLGLAIKV